MSAPCSVTDGRLKPCNPLNMAIEGPNLGRGKGVRFMQLTILGSGNFADGRSCATIKSGEFAKRGVILNFCPFCGADIGSHMVAEK